MAAEEALQNIARFFEIVRAQSALLADDRAIFVARHLQTLIEAGDDPPTAELDPDADAVAVLTVHKAKGLEFPVVFMPGLVTDRFPTHVAAASRSALPLELVDEMLPEGDFHLQEERRLFYVGDDPGARRADPVARRRLRRRAGAARLAVRARGAGPAGRGRGAGQRGAGVARRSSGSPRSSRRRRRPSRPRARRRAARAELLAIDDYLTCPLKFKYGHVLRVPLAPHHAMIYGSALHKAVQEFHRRHARGDVMSEDGAVRGVRARRGRTRASCRASTRRRASRPGRAALRRFREEQLQPGAVVPAYVEREFSFTLDGDRIRGRWDRVDIEPADLVPAGAGHLPADAGYAARRRRHADAAAARPGAGHDHGLQVERRARPGAARQRARDSLQLQIYAMGYEALTGRLPDAVQLHFLESGPRRARRGRPEAAREGARADREGRRRHAGPRLHAEPDPLSCSLLPVPRDLPVERRHGDARVGRVADVEAITFDFGNTLVPVDRAGLRRVVELTAQRRGRAARAVPASTRSSRSGRRSASGSSARRCRSSARSTSPSGSCASWRGSAGWRAPRPRALGPGGGRARIEPDGDRLGGRGLQRALRRGPAADRRSGRCSSDSRPGAHARDPVELAAGGDVDRYVEAAGWGRHLGAIVVSQRVGDDQAAPAIFAGGPSTALGEPRAGPAILHVGDDWAADVVGAKRAGWRPAYLTGRPRDSPLPASERDASATRTRTWLGRRPAGLVDATPWRIGRDRAFAPVAAIGSVGARMRAPETG